MDPKPQLIFITCGNTSALDAWLANTNFPAEKAYLDQEGVFYSGLKTHTGLFRTLLSPRMWIGGMAKRIWYGQLGTLFRSFAGYKLTVPERKEQSWQQGGTFIFRGLELQWSHYDQAPGDYPDFSRVVQEARKATNSLKQ